ncbi:T9SS type A sorting domain-containing protein [bacterium]|nr:T9SS type A sorting domain-containing protein [bacterium]
MKRRIPRLRAISFFGALWLYTVSVCFASVTGTVTFPDGNPVSGALVLFTDENNTGIHYSSVTDSNGKYTITDTMTGVDRDAETAAVPEDFDLHQNYPNPFNPATTIPFSLERPGFVELSVYNVLGQKIRTLVHDYYSPGEHMAVWNGLDDRGTGAGAGVYIYRLTCGGFMKTRKMLLLDGGNRDMKGISAVVPSTGGVVPKQAFPDQLTPKYQEKIAENSPTFRVLITGDALFPLELSGITMNDGDILDFTVSLLQFRTSATVTAAAGGKIELGNGARVVFSENFFTDDTTVTFLSAELLPPEYAVPYLHPVSSIYNVDLHGASVTGAETLSLPYDPSKIGADTEETDLFAAHWDGVRWTSKKGTVDTVSHTIAFESEHYPYWAVFYGQIVENVTVGQAYSMIGENNTNPRFVILDVRTPAEYAEHIPGAINIDYKSETFKNDVDALDKNNMYLVYCLAGSRSAGAVQIMQELGFREMYNMLGGIREWIMMDYPLSE